MRSNKRDTHSISTRWDDFSSGSLGSLFVSADDMNSATLEKRGGGGGYRNTLVQGPTLTIN